MKDWNPDKYLLFKKQRTQPAIDLAMRIKDCSPSTIADIGCGPGNSTRVLKQVFPTAEIIGTDSSENMIRKAQKENPDINFSVCDAQELTGKYDLLFSNACLQWIPNHSELIPKLMTKLNSGGILAVQIPMNAEEPLFRIINKTVEERSEDFRHTYFEQNDILSPEEYYNILSNCSNNFEIWETVYYHSMPSHRHLIEWVKTTRLRPYLEVLDEKQKAEFENQILRQTENAYPTMPNGEIIFKFRRLFFFAQK